MFIARIFIEISVKSRGKIIEWLYSIAKIALLQEYSGIIFCISEYSSVIWDNSKKSMVIFWYQFLNKAHKRFQLSHLSKCIILSYYIMLYNIHI